MFISGCVFLLYFFQFSFDQNDHFLQKFYKKISIWLIIESIENLKNG